VQRSVHFLGKLEAVAPLLAGADLFLLPSASESFGLSALEALASGVPVVASRAGGLSEVVRDGETGALRDVGDVAAMAAAGVDILGDRDRWAAMSAAAAADARTRFAQDAVVSQYEALYARAVAAHPRTARPTPAVAMPAVPPAAAEPAVPAGSADGAAAF
jgi:glycosyltransferase involved in cell wall biosynthesis